jgi:RNA polymerase-binding transcription factor DksA
MPQMETNGSKMQRKKLQQYKERLLAIRRRVTGEVEHMLESIQEEANPTGIASHVPLHFGDLASNALDADVRILETEQGILEDVQEALVRVENGSFGVCLSCNSPIAEERLESLPYTPHCIRCANALAGRV